MGEALHSDQRLPGERSGVETADGGESVQRQNTVRRPVDCPHSRTIGLELEYPGLVAPGKRVLCSRTLPCPLRHALESPDGLWAKQKKPRRPVLLRIDGAGTEKRPYKRSRCFGRSERLSSVLHRDRQY